MRLDVAFSLDGRELEPLRRRSVERSSLLRLSRATAHLVLLWLSGRGPGCGGCRGQMAEAEGVAGAPSPVSEPTYRGRGAMSGSLERDQQVEATQRALVEVLGPYEPLLSRVQAALVWERPAKSALWCLGLNAAFWWETGPWETLREGTSSGSSSALLSPHLFSSLHWLLPVWFCLTSFHFISPVGLGIAALRRAPPVVFLALFTCSRTLSPHIWQELLVTPWASRRERGRLILARESCVPLGPSPLFSCLLQCGLKTVPRDFSSYSWVDAWSLEKVYLCVW